MARLLFVGDVHTNLQRLKELIEVNEVDAVFQVGDFELYHSMEEAKADKKAMSKNPEGIQKIIDYIHSGALPFKTPIYYIKGNHEDFKNLDSMELLRLNINYMEQGDIINIKGVTIAGFGGIFSPIKFKWNKDKLVGKLNRFFNSKDLKVLHKNCKGKKIDVLITHQAATCTLPSKHKVEGIFHMNNILDCLKPSYYFHGHHHLQYNTNYNNTEVYGLGHFGKNPQSYKIIEING